jgi:hypothetical protein
MMCQACFLKSVLPVEGDLYGILKILGPGPDYVASHGKHDKQSRCLCLGCNIECLVFNHNLKSGPRLAM